MQLESLFIPHVSYGGFRKHPGEAYPREYQYFSAELKEQLYGYYSVPGLP